jgi:hypothetical protein
MNSGPHSILTVVVVVIVCCGCLLRILIYLPHSRTLAHSLYPFSLNHSITQTYSIQHKGKTTLLNNIANWEELEGFPKHLRVLHVKQELNTENEETTVINAVLDADIERTQLIQREKQLSLKLEQNDNGESGETKETKTTDATTAEEFTKDMKELKDVYDRLQLLGADTGTFTFCCHVCS